MNRKKTRPGYYILTCLESMGYDEGLFHWTAGRKYRMQVSEDGTVVMTSDDNIFTPTLQRYIEMIDDFKVHREFFRRDGVVDGFFK